MSWLGLDIGGTTTQAVICDDDLAVVDQVSAPTPALRGGTAMLDCAQALAERVRDRNPLVLIGAGVAAAGVLDPSSGRIVRASDSFAGWEGTEVAARIAERLQLPTAADNDVNCFLIGEVTGGSLQGVHHAVGITLGTGVGGALWSSGRILHGRDGAAGELGHLPGYGDELCSCGQRGHLETLASARSLLRRYRQRAGTARSAATSAADVASAAERGDTSARQVLAEAGAALGMTIVQVTRTLAADTVVIGGGVSGAWPFLRPSVQRVLDEHPPLFGPQANVHVAPMSATAVAVGAAALSRLTFSSALPHPATT
ncbi:ROK family protein [Kineococcus sp. SYSU DK005]|uniref:ROK family protein n=1 Tax=Kineococcus sp. SYSU DK005 TaxID=3383126 RepID=UPI003D7E46FD